MGENGLKASIWATQGQADFNHSQRPGNWICPACSFSNFQWRKECFRCSPPLNPTKVQPFRTNPAQNKNHSSVEVREENHPLSAPPIVRHHPAIHTLRPQNVEEFGLATSRWAPRDRNGTVKHGQVWTRIVSNPPILQEVPSANSNIPSNQISTAKNSDLGLPYQVQHYILSMIQRILEQGCYDFALRWIPESVHKKGWDCPEAVELSVWRAFLPAALPPNAIRPLSNYSLEAALGDAVRIRNSAVHRHLSDNNEIRKMALQAQDLMAMFSDVTRQSKFHQLWTELNVWDAGSEKDQHGSRQRLEDSLREIGEQPMDDMDWTPNAVSLQELPAGNIVDEEVELGQGDAMELD